MDEFPSEKTNFSGSAADCSRRPAVSRARRIPPFAQQRWAQEELEPAPGFDKFLSIRRHRLECRASRIHAASFGVAQRQSALFPVRPHVNDESLHDLQERFAWLERQSTERDAEILSLAERIRRLERQVEKLNEKAGKIPGDSSPLPHVEKPPHY